MDKGGSIVHGSFPISHPLGPLSRDGGSFLCLEQLLVEQGEDGAVGAVKVGALADEGGDARAVEVGADVLGHAAEGDGVALGEQALAELEHGLRAGNVHARHPAQGEDQVILLGNVL